MKKFYRSSEGIAVLIAAYVASAFGVTAIVDALVTAYGSLTAVPFGAPLALALVGWAWLGFFLYVEAVGRLAGAIDRATASWTTEVMSS